MGATKQGDSTADGEVVGATQQGDSTADGEVAGGREGKGGSSP